MERRFRRYQETAAIWRSQAEPRKARLDASITCSCAADVDTGRQPRSSTSLSDLILRFSPLSVHCRNLTRCPGPVELDGSNRAWPHNVVPPHQFEKPDAGFGYFQGYKLVGAMQKSIGRADLFHFSPQWDYLTDTSYQKGLVEIWLSDSRRHPVRLLRADGADADPVVTYDGSHQTIWQSTHCQRRHYDLERAGIFP